jgi:hypothetical protein
VDTIDQVFIGMKLIEAFFIKDEKIDQDTKSNTDAQTKGIDKGIELAFQDIAACNFKVAIDHWRNSLNGCSQNR